MPPQEGLSGSEYRLTSLSYIIPMKLMYAYVMQHCAQGCFISIKFTQYDLQSSTEREPDYCYSNCRLQSGMLSFLVLVMLIFCAKREILGCRRMMPTKKLLSSRSSGAFSKAGKQHSSIYKHPGTSSHVWCKKPATLVPQKCLDSGGLLQRRPPALTRLPRSSRRDRAELGGRRHCR